MLNNLRIHKKKALLYNPKATIRNFPIALLCVFVSTMTLMSKDLYIEGYGYAVAADTGSSIKGNKVDVYFNTLQECYDWGARNVKVTILGDSSGK